MDKPKNLFETNNEQVMQQQQPDRFLLQINRIKLSDYIAYGLITPDKYLGNEIEHDVQSKNPNLLAFSGGYIDALNEQQIILEVIFTESEKERLEHVGDIYYFDIPLPLTRIKKIYVQDNKIKKHILKNLDTGDVGSLPANLFESYKNKNFNSIQYTPFKAELDNDFLKNIRCYNGTMGMFSFMKNVGIYYSNYTGIISNYTKGYVSALSIFLNDPIEEKPFEFLNILTEHQEFKGFLYSDQEMSKDFIENEIDKIEDEETKEIFKQLLLPNKKRKTLEALAEKKAWYYYYVALVYYFRDKTANKKDNFKIDVASLIPQEIAETAFAILGIYLGYSSLRANESFELQDRYYKKIFASRYSVKNELASKLDYILMESVYQTCFNKRKKVDVPSYLVYPTKIIKLPLPTSNEFKTWYKTEEKEYFETSCIRITKMKASEIVSNGLEKYGDEIVFGKDYLTSFIDKRFGHLINYSKDGKPCKPFCKKDAFLEAMEHLEKSKSFIPELLKVFEIDKKLR